MDLQSFQVYVGNLDGSTTERELFDCLRGVTEHVQNVRVIRDVSGKCQGYGFAKFSSDEDAYRVVAKLNSLVIPASLVLRGRPLLVCETYRLSKTEIESGLDGMGHTIFVGNLNILMKDDELKNAFAKFGLILGSHIVPGKGFGFVTFSDNTAALAALSAMQNEELLHQRIYCFWARNDQQLHEEQRLGLKANALGGQIETSYHLVPNEIGAPATQEIYPVDTIKCLQEALVSLPDTRGDKKEEPPFPTLRARNDAFAASKVKELFSESWCT